MSRRILVVDDEPDVLLLCRVNLGFEGYSVLEAHDGREALELVKSKRPDLVLLDVMMPGIDGWKVLSEIRNDPAISDIPVVMLTAKVQERDQMRGWRDGAVDYITKPFSPIALTRTVNEALAPHTREELERKRRRMLDKLSLTRSA